MRTQRISAKRILASLLMLFVLSFSYASSPFSPQDRAENPGSGSDTEEAGIDSGGLINGNETVCGSGSTLFIGNEASPSGDFDGFLQIKWEKRTSGGVWTEIPGENTLAISPGWLDETTEFRRACRTEIHQPWVYSNVVTKLVVQGIENVKIVSSDVTCKFGNDGKASAQVLGGTPGFFFSWSNGAISNSVFNFAAGTYFLTVTDQNGCTFTTDNFEIKEPEQVVTVSEAGNLSALCPGSSDGALVAIGMNGVEPYTYLWSNGQTSMFNTDIPAGTYGVTVTDALGCSNSLMGLTVTQPAEIEITGNERTPTCFGFKDGAVELEISGGTGPYFQIWDDGRTESTRNDLDAGTYNVIIIDANGCDEQKTIEVLNPEPIVASPYVVNNIICRASVNMVPSGGTAPYEFEWSTGETEGFLTNLCPGDYYLTTTDANDCKRMDTLTISADYTIEEIKIEMVVSPYIEAGEIVVTLPYEEVAQINVYTTAGQLVTTYTDVIPSDQKEIHLNLDLSKFSNGMYIIRVDQLGLSTSGKLVLAN